MDIRIIDDWKAEGIAVNGPAGNTEISACEATLSFSFPDDFKFFYSLCNGFTEWAMDSRMLSLWSLEKMISENSEDDFIAFADYNANGSQVGYIRGKDGLFHDYNREKFCDTFEQFIDHWRAGSGEYM